MEEEMLGNGATATSATTIHVLRRAGSTSTGQTALRYAPCFV